MPMNPHQLGGAAKVALFGLVLFLAFLTGRDPAFGFGMLVVGAGIALVLWTRLADKDLLVQLVLAILLWLGFFHEPISYGNYVFWAQEVLAVGVLAVMISRTDRGFPVAFKPVLVPLAVLAAITLPVSLTMESPLVYLNGLRRIGIAPLLFVVGQSLLTKRSPQLASRFLVWTLILQLPASIILVTLRNGSPFGLTGPDILTGTFGRGGTGYIAIYAAAVLSIIVWQFWNRWTSLPVLSLAVGAFVALGVLSDLKFLYILLPASLLVVFLMELTKPRGSGRWRNVLVGFVVMAVLMAALNFVVSASSERYHGGALKPSSFLDPEYYREFLYMGSGGVISGDAGRTRLSRYGALAFASEYVSRDVLSLIAGYGLGSTASEGVLGATSLKELLEIGEMDASAISVLLFESGVGGTLLYVTPFFLLMAFALRTLRKEGGMATNLAMLSEMLVLYGVGILASLGYNGFALTPRGGGVFWLLAGLWFAARREQASKTGGGQQAKVPGHALRVS